MHVGYWAPLREYIRSCDAFARFGTTWGWQRALEIAVATAVATANA
jgi:hypothetical protein